MLKRAWMLVNRDRSVFDMTGLDGFPPDRLVEHLRELCFGVGAANSAACMFSQVYGRADVVVAVEWDSTDPGKNRRDVDELAPLDQAVMVIDHPQEVGTRHAAGVATTETLIRIAPHEPTPGQPTMRSLTTWDSGAKDRVLNPTWGDGKNEPVAVFVGIHVKGGQHQSTMRGVSDALNRCGFDTAIADAVFGMYDIFVAISASKSKAHVKEFLAALRRVPGIRRTETLFSHPFVFEQ